MPQCWTLSPLDFSPVRWPYTVRSSDIALTNEGGELNILHVHLVRGSVVDGVGFHDFSRWTQRPSSRGYSDGPCRSSANFRLACSAEKRIVGDYPVVSSMSSSMMFLIHRAAWPPATHSRRKILPLVCARYGDRPPTGKQSREQHPKFLVGVEMW